MPALLEIAGLRTHIRVRRGEVVAVDGLTLSVARGETLGVVGDSGCGKTTTALSILQLLPPGGYLAGGSICLDGTELMGMPERSLRVIRGAHIGMVFQDPTAALNPTMMVGEQISEGVSAHLHLSRRDSLARAEEMLGLVGVEDPRRVCRFYPHQLSGGMRQRVMISMATACEPRLLIADEPTTAVDASVAGEIMEVLQALKQRMGLAILLLTHDPSLVAGWADRVAVMRAGRIIATDEQSRAAKAEPDVRGAGLPPSAWGLS